MIMKSFPRLSGKSIIMNKKITTAGCQSMSSLYYLIFWDTDIWSSFFVLFLKEVIL